MARDMMLFAAAFITVLTVVGFSISPARTAPRPQTVRAVAGESPNVTPANVHGIVGAAFHRVSAGF